MSRTATGVFAVAVTSTNPNGSPSENGAPRVFPDGRGFMSAVSVKSKLRKLLASHEGPEWEQILKDNPFVAANPDRYHIFESKTRGFDTKDPKEANKLVAKMSDEELAERFWDVRVFGCTALDKAIGINVKKRGKIVVGLPTTVDPVDIHIDGITKLAPFRTKEDEKTGEDKELDNDIANDGIKVVRYGLYLGRYRVHAGDLSEDDLTLFKYLLRHCWRNTGSSSRCLDWVFGIHAEHENAFGSFCDEKLVSNITPVLKEGVDQPLHTSDYLFKSFDSLAELLNQWGGVAKLEEL